MNEPVCYCILVHQSSDLLRLLVTRLLEDSRSVVVIHVDSKIRGLADRLSGDYSGCDRLLVCSTHKVRWGHYSMCLAMAACIDNAFDSWPGLNRVVFLSGQHFLLAPATDINDFFDSACNILQCFLRQNGLTASTALQ